MIYEVRTYRLKPRTIGGYVKAFGEAYEKRKEISPISAFFTSEVGPLNEAIHIWPYEDLAARDKVRAEASKADFWPPVSGGVIEEQRSEIFRPLPVIGEFGSGDLGPIFEWREYTISTGMMGTFKEWWSSGVPERRKVSPMVMAMESELGELSKFIHIWGYKSFEERNKLRAETASNGIWPPPGIPEGALYRQRNMICLAAPFSPVK
jgi:hypothetical protein